MGTVYSLLYDTRLSIEGDHPSSLYLIHVFQQGLRQLVSFLPRLRHRTVFRFYHLDLDVIFVIFLLLVVPLCLDHVRFYFHATVFYILEYVRLQDPTKHVELPYRRLDAFLVFVKKSDSIPPSEGVKVGLAVTFELRSIRQVDVQMNDVIIDFSRDDRVILFAIIGDEPIDQSERYLRFAIDDRYDLLNIVLDRVKPRQRLHQQIIGF